MQPQLLESRKTRTRGGSPAQRNGRHAGDIIIGNEARIPSWVRDLASFRRWSCSDSFPERGELSFLDGELWVDLSMETLAHNQIKTIITIVLGSLILGERLGRFMARDCG